MFVSLNTSHFCSYKTVFQILLFLYLVCMYVGACVHTCHGIHVSIRGHLMRISSLFLPYVDQGSNSGFHIWLQAPSPQVLENFCSVHCIRFKLRLNVFVFWSIYHSLMVEMFKFVSFWKIYCRPCIYNCCSVQWCLELLSIASSHFSTFPILLRWPNLWEPSL